MFEYAKLILWKVSVQKNLFKNKLVSIVNLTDRNEFSRLKKYCYAKYYDMYPEIIDEIFKEEKRDYVTQGMRRKSFTHAESF